MTASFSSDSPKTMMNRTSLTCTSSNTARTATGSTAAIRLPNRRRSSSPIFRSPAGQAGRQAEPSGPRCGEDLQPGTLTLRGLPGASSGCCPADCWVGSPSHGDSDSPRPGAGWLRDPGPELPASLPWAPTAFRKGWSHSHWGLTAAGSSLHLPRGLVSPSWPAHWEAAASRGRARGAGPGTARDQTPAWAACCPGLGVTGDAEGVHAGKVARGLTGTGEGPPWEAMSQPRGEPPGHSQTGSDGRGRGETGLTGPKGL